MAQPVNDGIPYVPVAGLRVPATVVPSIIIAFRGTYPTLTEGLDDEAAVRAVLLHWVTATMTSFAETATLAPAAEIVQTLVEEYEVKGKKAREAAAAAAATIVEAPAAPTDEDLDLADFAGLIPVTPTLALDPVAPDVAGKKK